MALTPGARFGSYEAVEPIGAGGMGEVWRARDTELKRDVAVKVLPASFASDEDRVARFRREAELLASLNHTNIAQVYGLEKLDDQIVIVMELVEGPTLADRISEGPIPPDQALEIAFQVIAALEAAHASQIVHRDLKPANIKLNQDSIVKVLDFGISKSIDPQAISVGSPVMTTPAVTQTGVILGTAAYMSPEQARGKFVDQRTDIWAFGCLLFEMLTGQPAFGGEDVMLTLARVLDRDTDLSSIPKTISPAVRHTLELCLEKDPRRRIADIRDVRLSLEGKFETGFPGLPEVVGERSLWRRALVPILAMTLGGLAVGASSWLLLQSGPPPVTRYVDALPEGVELGSSGDPALGISPSGDRIAFAASDALYIRDSDDYRFRRLDGTAGEGAVHPVFSPDGEDIAYWSAEQQLLKRISVNGGSPLTITAAANPLGPFWAEDDTLIYGGLGGRIWQVPVSGGQEPAVLYQQMDGQAVASKPSLLPGGRILMYSSADQIHAVDLESGERVTLFAGAQATYLDSGHVIYSGDGADSLKARTFDPRTLEFSRAVALVDNNFVSPSGAVQYAVSARGNLIYFEAISGIETANGSVLAIGEPDGSVTALPVPQRTYNFPTVSPDGTRLAVEVIGERGPTHIFVYELSGETELRQLTFEGNANLQPSWKDNETLLFSSDRSDGVLAVYEQVVDGGSAVRLTDPDENSATGHQLPSIAPDGRLIYAAVGVNDLFDMFIVASSGETMPLVNESGIDAAAVFSSDSSIMAYTATSSANTETYGVYIDQYPPNNAKRLVSREGEISVYPRWVRNNAESVLTLAYQEPLRGVVVAVDITLPGLGFGNRRTLFPYVAANSGTGRGFDSIPGSDRFVLTWNPSLANDAYARELQPSRIIVVENWIEEVKERVRSD